MVQKLLFHRMSHYAGRVMGLAAYSGTGKTSLLKSLIRIFKERGLRVGLIKKSHHDIEIDQPGKDSYELRMAGASPVMLSTSHRRVMITEHQEIRERGLAEELAFFDGAGIDIVLVEGFKQEQFPKIELHRPSLGKPLLFPADPFIVAIACDGPLPMEPPIPIFDLNSPEPIAEFIYAYLFNPHLQNHHC